MKQSNEHIENVERLWKEMKDIDDLTQLLNLAKEQLYGTRAIKLKKKDLTYYLAPVRRSNSYHEFSIRKKSGGKRTICAPQKSLLHTQKALNYVLQIIGEVNENAFGFVQGKSIVDNATKHVGKNYVLNIDIKDFFPSVEQARVWARLQHPPFSLSDKRKELANIIASICCHELDVERYDEDLNDYTTKTRSVLPQGAPTSPTITNFICNRLDRKMMGIAKRFGLTYSRYADDITFSSEHYVYDRNGVFFLELKRVMELEGFRLQEKKIRLQCSPYRQEVTGIIVNEKLNLRKKYIKEVRMWLYMWERYGLIKASKLFDKQYKKDERRSGKELVNVLPGKIHFIKMVKGENDSTYVKLRDRYWKLIGSHKLWKKELDINAFLDDVDEMGFNDAIEKHL